jgi:SAM-dependent methyltransferase
MLNEVYVSRKLGEVKEYEEGIGERLKKLNESIKERTGKFEVMGFIPRGLVVDFGTGIGVGVDIASKGLKVAKDSLSRGNMEFHLIRADALFPPFRDNVFDAVNFSYMLHHHPFSFLKRIMREVDRISRKNSVMLLAEPSYLNESFEFSNEIDRVHVGARDLEKLSPICNLGDLGKIGYDLHAFGYYGNVYPSILKKVLESHGFRIAKTRVVSETVQAGEVIGKLKKDIESLSLDESAKKYLAERLEDLMEKCSIIDPLHEFTLYIKAVRD